MSYKIEQRYVLDKKWKQVEEVVDGRNGAVKDRTNTNCWGVEVKKQVKKCKTY